MSPCLSAVLEKEGNWLQMESFSPLTSYKTFIPQQPLQRWKWDQAKGRGWQQGLSSSWTFLSSWVVRHTRSIHWKEMGCFLWSWCSFAFLCTVALLILIKFGWTEVPEISPEKQGKTLPKAHLSMTYNVVWLTFCTNLDYVHLKLHDKY